MDTSLFNTVRRQIVRFVWLSAAAVMMVGCDGHLPYPHRKDPLPEKTKQKPKKEISIAQKMEKYKFKAKHNNLKRPKRVYKFNTDYPKLPRIADKKISFSAEDAPLSQVLYTLFKDSDFNLIIDKEIDKNTPIAISVKEARTQDVLAMVMDMADATYEVKGNIVHVKKLMEKSFYIPYVNTVTNSQLNLGGDMLSASTGGGGGGGGNIGISGSYTVKSSVDKESSDFFKQIEANIKSLLSKDGSFTLNRFSNTLFVKDHKKNIDMIARMLERVLNHAHRQVLIEAKIFEVALNDENRMGIKWNKVFNSIVSQGDSLILDQHLELTGQVTASMVYTSELFSVILNAMEGAGEVEVLSSPHIQVLSGQSAIISSGKLIPFYEKEVNINQGTGGSATTVQVQYNRRDILDGLLLGVSPVILDDDTIMINITPISANIESIQEFYDEEGRPVASAPIVNVKELGTTVYAKDNALISIGGLISDIKSKSNENVPHLSRMPILGKLFTRNQEVSVKRELVILMKVKIVQ